jgi:hypothetical protein
MKSLLKLGLVGLVAATPARAQSLDEPAESPPWPKVSTPPLVPAPQALETPEAPDAPDAPRVAPALGQPEAPPPGPELAAAPVDEPGRPLRIAMAVLFGAASGAALAVAGGFIGRATIRSASVQPLGSTWTGAGAGFAVGAPVGVLLAGWLFDGDGAWWASVLGELAGVAAGAGAVLFGGVEGVPLLFALPLAGSVLGYEFSSHGSRTQVAPTLSLGPGGGSLGVRGRF